MAIDVTAIHVGPGTLELFEIVNGTPNSTADVTVAASNEGGALAYSRGVQMLTIDEAIGPIDHFVDDEELTFEIAANEFTAKTLQAAFGHGTITTTAPGTGVAGSDELTFGGAPINKQYKLVYTVPRRTNPNLNIVITLHQVVSVSEVESGFTKTGKTAIPMQFRALADLSKPKGEQLGTILIETAEATG